MKRYYIKRKILINSLIISFVYVGIGTVSVLSLYPDGLLPTGLWAILGVLITLPVSIVSFGIMYTEPSNILLVLIVQSVIFLLFSFVIFKIIKWKKS
ncbi:hypothetical protein ACFLS4_02600 [Bacteroidota bacterium]